MDLPRRRQLIEIVRQQFRLEWQLCMEEAQDPVLRERAYRRVVR